ncbi:MAG TPA: type II secretion system protein GspM [Gammaproteobacteria bacterium]|nr:type II secretion system protein GspM [Gammaproteobacteria bacterium]
MLEYFYRLTPRERAIVAAAVLVAVGLGLHALVIEPYQQRLAALEDAVEQQRADLTWMRSAVVDMPAGEIASASNQIEGTLASFINQAVSNLDLTSQLSQISPIGSDEVRMRYNAVEFNRLVNFIARVNASGLDIKDLRITAVESPGKVDCSLILVRH